MNVRLIVSYFNRRLFLDTKTWSRNCLVWFWPWMQLICASTCSLYCLSELVVRGGRSVMFSHGSSSASACICSVACCVAQPMRCTWHVSGVLYMTLRAKKILFRKLRHSACNCISISEQQILLFLCETCHFSKHELWPHVQYISRK